MPTTHDHAEPEFPRIMFTYWGRRGLTQFALQLAHAALADHCMHASISVSRQNEALHEFRIADATPFVVDTFSSNTGVILEAWRIPLIRRQLAARIRRDRIQAVVELMPHVWSSFIAPAIRAAGARHVVLVHDADVHPGDYRTFLVKRLLDRTVMRADVILTLSNAVTVQLSERQCVLRNRIHTLFHPIIMSRLRRPHFPPLPDQPIRLFFLGRIMRYKGLDLFLETIDRLRSDGVAVEVGIFGEGQLGDLSAKLDTLGAEVINRWLSATEIDAVLARCHAVVLCHSEASQSGVAAMALGAGVPVVATPVGGLVEQIQDGVTGMIARTGDATGMSDAIKRLFRDPASYRAICSNILRAVDERSMARFVHDCARFAVHAGRMRRPPIV